MVNLSSDPSMNLYCILFTCPVNKASPGSMFKMLKREGSKQDKFGYMKNRSKHEHTQQNKQSLLNIPKKVLWYSLSSYGDNIISQLTGYI